MVVRVKVCGITREEDAGVALELGAKKLGFILYEKSPRKIGFNDIRKIKTKFSLNVDQMVAVQVEPTIDSLKGMIDFGFGFYQLHFSHNYPREQIEKWAELAGVDNLWLAPRLPVGTNFPEDLLPFAQTFLIDAYSKDQFGGTGEPSDWYGFLKWKNKYSSKSWILAGGLSSENIQEALSKTQANLIDVNSGVEISPGIKDRVKINEFFAKIS